MMLTPAWTPDGTGVYVTVIEDAGPRAAEIWRFDVATGRGERVVENGNGLPAPLISTPAPGAFGAAPSPDGSALFFTSVTPRAYGSRNGASTLIMRRDLTSGATVPLPLLGSLPLRPAFSPDGRWLVYGAVEEGRTGPRLRHGSDTIVPFEAAVSLAATKALAFPRRVDTGAVRARRLQQLAVAPDGRVAYAALARIYASAAHGRTPTRLTRTQRPREFHPARSPDGRWIAFITWDESGGSVWKAPVDGRLAPVHLSQAPAYGADPVWTPAGASTSPSRRRWGRPDVPRHPSLTSYLIGNRRQRQWLVQASHELGLIPTPGGGADGRANLTHAVVGYSGTEHALPNAPLYNDVVQLIARSGITSPRLSSPMAAPFPSIACSPFRRRTTTTATCSGGGHAVLGAGGRVALGGHGEVQGLSNHWEMLLLSGGGMAPHDVCGPRRSGARRGWDSPPTSGRWSRGSSTTW